MTTADSTTSTRTVLYYSEQMKMSVTDGTSKIGFPWNIIHGRNNIDILVGVSEKSLYYFQRCYKTNYTPPKVVSEITNFVLLVPQIIR